MAIKENALPLAQSSGSGTYIRTLSSGGESQRTAFDIVKGAITADMDDAIEAEADAREAADDQLQTEIDGKVDKVTGKGLSTNDFTNDLKTKLDGIAAGAEVNVQPDWNQTNTGADDYIKNKPGNATTSAAGFMSAADKTKLDGIEAGAEVNIIETVKVNGTALVPDANRAVDVPAPTVDSALSTTSTNPVQNKVIDAALTDLKEELKEIATLSYNFEAGTYSTTNQPRYNKLNNFFSARNIDNFFVYPNTTIELSDTDYEFNMLTIDPTTGLRTGTTGWVKTYTVLNPRICFLAFRKTTQDEPSESLLANIASIFTADSIKIMCENVSLLYHIDNINNDIYNTQMQSKIFNFEVGSFASTSTWYNKTNNTKMGRNRVPFVAKYGDVIALSNANYEFYGLLFTKDYVPAGNTGWTSKYTFPLDRICFLAFRNRNQTENIEIPTTVNNIFTADSINVMSHIILVGKEDDFTTKQRYINGNSYNHLLSNVFVQGTFLANKTDWNDFPKSNASLFSINEYKYDYYWWVQEATTVNDPTQVIKYVRVINENGTIYKDWTPVSDGYLQISADIVNIPSVIDKPTIEYINDLQSGVICQAKGAIFKNQDAYCVTYGENLDGTIDDFPRVSTSGTLALKYRSFTLSGGTEGNVHTGTIAQKGTTYTAWDGTTKTFEGGCGLPSGNNGYQFFVGAYTGTSKYNGINNYGMTPCCVPVTVNSNGNAPTFGTIKELTLTINGVLGAFDVKRINSNYVNYQLYYTTNPPCYDSGSGTWYWLIPVISGFILCTSTNAVDWTYVKTVTTPYQPFAEIACVVFSSTYLLYASRNAQQGITVGLIKKSGNDTINEYIIPAVSAKVALAKVGNEFLMLLNETNKDECVCIRISSNSTRLFFHRWFSIYNECTWYSSFEQSTIENGTFTKLYLVGNNGDLEENRGISFAVLNLTNGYETIGDITTMIL